MYGSVEKIIIINDSNDGSDSIVREKSFAFVHNCTMSFLWLIRKIEFHLPIIFPGQAMTIPAPERPQDREEHVNQDS